MLNDSEEKMISWSAYYKQVNVRCREDHKAQNMVEFDEEVYCSCNCFYKPDRIRAQTNRAQSHIFEITSRKIKHNALFQKWWFDTEFSRHFYHGVLSWVWLELK